MDEERTGSKTAVNDDDITPVTRDQQLRLKNATKGGRTKADGKVSHKKKEQTFQKEWKEKESQCQEENFGESRESKGNSC